MVLYLPNCSAVICGLNHLWDVTSITGPLFGHGGMKKYPNLLGIFPVTVSFNLPCGKLEEPVTNYGPYSLEIRPLSTLRRRVYFMNSYFRRPRKSMAWFLWPVSISRGYGIYALDSSFVEGIIWFSLVNRNHVTKILKSRCVVSL